MPMHLPLPLAASYVFPEIIFGESQRWGTIALVCALLLAAETVVLWRKGRAAARPRPWRVFGFVVSIAALGVLGASGWELWTHWYYLAHPAEVSVTGADAAVALLYDLQTVGQCAATAAALLVAGGLIALYNTHINADERRRHMATRSRP
jgi:hypothetical protein